MTKQKEGEMIDFVFVVIIVVVIALCVVAFRIMESVSQALLMFNIVFFVILLIAGAIIFNDLRTYNEAFPGREKIILVDDHGKLLAAYKWQGNNTQAIDTESYSQAFAKNDFSGVLRGKQMIWVINSGLFQERKLNYSAFPSLFSSATTVISEYKKGNMRAYPAPLFFKVANIMPISWLVKEK